MVYNFAIVPIMLLSLIPMLHVYYESKYRVEQENKKFQARHEEIGFMVAESLSNSKNITYLAGTFGGCISKEDRKRYLRKHPSFRPQMETDEFYKEEVVAVTYPITPSTKVTLENISYKSIRDSVDGIRYHFAKEHPECDMHANIIFGKEAVSLYLVMNTSPEEGYFKVSDEPIPHHLVAYAGIQLWMTKKEQTCQT